MDENLIAINVPNGVSIVIMAVVGGFLLALVRKAVLSRMNAPAADAGSASGYA